MAGSDSGYERLGAKLLSLPDVIAQSVGFMGPVFSSAFVIPLVIGVISASGQGGGLASPLSVLIAAVGVFALGWIVSTYAKQIHAAGSLYDYVTRGLGERVGTAAGWLYYGGVTVLLTGLLLLIGGYLESTIQGEFKVDPLPSWAWTVLLIALIAGILYFGVRISTRSQLALALISMLVVGAFFIFVIVKLGSANTVQPFNPSSAADGWSGIFFGVLYGVLIFVGFETAANLAEETPHPRREIPIAVMATATIATVWYVLATYVEVAGFHLSIKTITETAGAPLFALGAPASAGGYGGTWIDRLLELVVLFDMIAVAIGCAVSASRGVFAMARDRRLTCRAGQDVAAARLAARRGRLHHSRRDRHPPDQPVLDKPVRAAGDAALLRAVRMGIDLRRLRARGGLPADVCRRAAELLAVRWQGAAGHRGRARRPDHRGRHLRVVLQGHQPDDLGALARAGAARGRIRLDVRAPASPGRKHAARRPERRGYRRGSVTSL